MTCKACHPKKTKFVQGKIYVIKGESEEYIAAHTGPGFLYALISLSNGNRWSNPSTINEIGSGEEFMEVK